MRVKGYWLIGGVLGLIVIVFFTILISSNTRNLDTKNLKAQNELVIDVSSHHHSFSEWTSKSMAMFGDLLFHQGVKDFFSVHNLYVSNFSLSAIKIANGYSISQMDISIDFSDESNLYTQSYSLKNKEISSKLAKYPSSGEASTGTLLYDLMPQLDKLDIGYFSEQLISHDQIVINYLYESIAVNPDDTKTFFVFSDGEIRFITDKSNADIKDGAQVLEITALKSDAGNNEIPVDKVRIYLLKH